MRGLPSEDKDDNSQKLLQNYTTAFMTLALEFRTRGDLVQAKEVMDRALQMLPYDWRVTMFCADIYSNAEEWDGFDKLFDDVMALDSANIRLIRVFADIAYQKGLKEKLTSIMDRALKANPEDETLFMANLGYMYQNGETDRMNTEIEKWLEVHPENEQLRRYLEQVKQQRQMQGAPSTPQATGEIAPENAKPVVVTEPTAG